MVYYCIINKKNTPKIRKNLRQLGDNIVNGHYTGPKLMIVENGKISLYDHEEKFKLIKYFSFEEIEKIKYKTEKEFKITTLYQYIYITTRKDNILNEYMTTKDYFNQFNEIDELKDKLTYQKRFSLGQYGSKLKIGILNALGNNNNNWKKNKTYLNERDSMNDITCIDTSLNNITNNNLNNNNLEEINEDVLNENESEEEKDLNYNRI